jgi:hypothetical protein
MKVINAPLMDTVQFTAYDGEIQTGLHIATIASDSGLSEYVIVYDPAEDKVMAFLKRYMNPEDPADYDILGIADPDLLKEISYFCNKEGLFDHLPVKEDAEETNEE